MPRSTAVVSWGLPVRSQEFFEFSETTPANLPASLGAPGTVVKGPLRRNAFRIADLCRCALYLG